MKPSSALRVLMVGVSDPPPAFIARQVSVLESLGVQVFRFPEFRKRKYIANVLLYWGIFLHIPRQTRALFREVDLVHFQWPGHLIAYYPLAKRANKPIVVSLRGRQINITPFAPGNARYVKDLRRILPLCDAYHCVSENILLEAQNFGLEPKRAYVIRPAIDTSIFYPVGRSIPSRPARLLMIGALIWRKGYEYALLVMKRLVDAGVDAQLTIVGDGNECDRIQYTIQDLELQDRVYLLGQVNPSQVLELLHDSQVFLHTALSEGIANVVLEAMACGLPVVSFSSGGIDEVIDHGKDGFLAKTRDVDDVTKYVIRIVTNPELRHSLGAAARQKIQSQFELKSQGQQFIDLYTSLIEK